MDTGQTEDDTFNSKPIDADLDDSEQLTDESIQHYLTLVGQLQWLVTLGRLAIHAQVTTLSTFRSTPRKLQPMYGYVKKTITFHWIQFEYYLSEMLSKHWDLIKILPMIAKLLMTLFPRSQHLWKHPCYPKNWIIHTTLKFPSSTHTHTQNYISLHSIIHASTRTCHIDNKRGVTEVWHIAHFWVSYGRCSMPGLPWDGQKDCPGDGKIMWDKREITRNVPHCMLLGVLWQSCFACNLDYL